uniref:RNA polymerase subunit H/Rpb5 C-terminal domain-containing protein n=1 Tax=viral metagenome TaxID=1070528 RepID=A0A6C0JTC2_9ZZZZ
MQEQIDTIKRNVFSMLQRRGYKNVKEEDKSEDENIKFIVSFENPNNDTKKQGHVIYCDSKIGIEQLSSLFAPYIDQKMQVILIYVNITNPVLKAFRENISKFLKNTEIINVAYLYQDIMTHSLVPQYKLLTEEEKEEILKQYNSTADLFPRMLVNDPVCIIMNFKIGSMIKVLDHYNFTLKRMDYRMPPAISYCVVDKAD